jgi:glycerol-3-phosphate acyltransferase PlsY
MPANLIGVVMAYLLGSIPFGYLLVRFVFTAGEDIRKVGSGGIGATNVTRRAGRAAGLLTYLLDVAKGLAAVALVRFLSEGDYLWMGVAAIAAIAGHIFPIFLGFRGGKGVATAVGAYVTLAPLAVLAALLLWALVVYFSRYVSLGSLVAAVAVPIFTLLFYGWLKPSPHLGALLAAACGACVLIVGAHHENIGRLIRRQENKIGAHVGSSQGGGR